MRIRIRIHNTEILDCYCYAAVIVYLFRVLAANSLLMAQKSALTRTVRDPLLQLLLFAKCLI